MNCHPGSTPGTGTGWTQAWMDTLVTVRVACPASEAGRWKPAADRAFAWFAAVEVTCSRFIPDGDVAVLARQPGEAVTVSPILFTALQIALEAARLTGGAFDPAVGGRLAAAGYDRNYRTGQRFGAGLRLDPSADWRDIHLDPAAGTVTVTRPALLDLGAVAKGLAVDLAIRELARAPGAVIDAGGDAYLHGRDRDGLPWRVAIADPRHPGALLGSLALSGQAIATSGTYARNHILTPGGPRPGTPVISATVLAPATAVADALSCAALVLGLPAGLDLVCRADGAEALLIGDDGTIAATPGFPALTGTA